MVRPLTPTELRAALDRWHVPYDLVAGWATRDNGGHWTIDGTRDHVIGCMAHHTAGDASDLAERSVIVNGRTGLPGPLANFGVTDVGRLDVIAAGSANHAGRGDPDTLRKVTSQAYAGNIYPDQHSSSPGSVAGNGRFYGFETYYGIRNDPTVNALQYRVLVLGTAAVLDALDRVDSSGTRWTGKRAIGHKEWTDWKPDPAGIVMSSFRGDVQWCLDNGPAAARRWYDTGSKTAPAPTPTPTPTTSRGSIMALPVLVQILGTAPVYKSDGFRRVHVTKAERDAILLGHRLLGVPDEIIQVSGTEQLAAYGRLEDADGNPVTSL